MYVFLFSSLGIVRSQQESLFTYRIGEEWSTFVAPQFPAEFHPVFSDSRLELDADTVCGDNQFCQFDIAVTQRLEVGQSTVRSSRRIQEIANLSAQGC